MNPITQTIKEKEEYKKIVRGQYPDLFDIAKNGQSVWLEKSYMESLLELFCTLLYITNKQLLESVVGMMEGTKKKVIVNMLQDDEIFQERGMDGVKGFNQALQDTLIELQGALKELKDNEK